MTIIFADSLEEVEVIPSGLFIDKLTGIGGIPRGAITEIFGDESIGKSSLCLQLIANAQKMGLKCLLADVEWSYSPLYASTLGVDNKKLSIIRERFAETVLDAIEEASESGKWDLIILDSVGAILPRAEAEKGAEGKTIGGQAGLIAKFCRKIVPSIKINNVALLVVNHSFIDVMSSKIMTSGGKKLSYHKSLSIRLKQKFGVSLKQGDRKIGKVVVGEVKKNKFAATEGLEIDGHLIFGQAFSASQDLIGDALEKGIITRQGNSYMYEGKKLSTGLIKLRKAIEENPALAEKIKLALNEDKDQA